MDKFTKAAIVILTYNNLEYSKACIESIRKYTDKDSYEIIVVDNNSTDGTQEWLKTQSDITIKLNDFNAGFPKGCNMGIDLASPESDILLLNNDTVVTANWLKNLQTCLYSNEKIGAAGAVSNHNENLQGVDFRYDNFDEMQLLAEKNNLSNSSKWEEKIFLIGFCLLIRRTVLNRIGNLAEEYSPGYVEDNDLSLRILTAGYRLMLCHDCFIHHYLGSEFRKDPGTFYPVLFKNREIFRKKWGFETFRFDEVDFASLRIFSEPEHNKEPKVLEIGCKLGLDLLKIKYQCPGALLYGLEPDSSLAAISSRVAQVIIKPINTFPLDFPENDFDCILIGNSVEHVENPETYLAGLIKYLKPGGVIISRFQNMMHYSVIRDILRGNWLYAQNDMLNRSNSTYFTLNDLKTLFERCGYRNPFVFHWFSTPDEEDQRFIKKLCDMNGESNSYLYYTYLYSVKFQK